MHLTFFCALAALAHLRAEPFLLLGVAAGNSLAFLAPVTRSVTTARRAAAAATAVVLAVFAAAAYRDGAALPGAAALVPPAVLVHCLGVWVAMRARQVVMRARAHADSCRRPVSHDCIHPHT